MLALIPVVSPLPIGPLPSQLSSRISTSSISSESTRFFHLPVFLFSESMTIFFFLGSSASMAHLRFCKVHQTHARFTLRDLHERMNLDNWRENLPGMNTWDPFGKSRKTILALWAVNDYVPNGTRRWLPDYLYYPTSFHNLLSFPSRLLPSLFASQASLCRAAAFAASSFLRTSSATICASFAIFQASSAFHNFFSLQSLSF